MTVACVQIWSTDTAVLYAACRGHSGEITDLSVSSGNEVAASGSIDGTIRCWSLQASPAELLHAFSYEHTCLNPACWPSTFK